MIWGIFQYQQLDYALGIASIPLMIILILKLLKLNGYIFYLKFCSWIFIFDYLSDNNVSTNHSSNISMVLIIEKNITFKFSAILAMMLLIVFFVQFNSICSP